LDTEKLEKISPDIKYAEYLGKRSELERNAAESERLPLVQLKTVYSFEDSVILPQNPSWYAGLNLTVPLFHGGSISAQIKQAEEKKNQADEFLKQTKLNVSLKFKSGVAVFLDGISRLKTTKRVLDLSMESLTAAELKYNAGKLTALEIIDAEIVWSNARLNYCNNGVDSWLALFEIEAVCPEAVKKEAP
jgi:outer membrane protein